MDERRKKTLIDVIHKAIKREEDAFNYYQKASAKADYPEIESLFIQLAEEERRHRYFLTKERDKISKLVIEQIEGDFIDEKEVRYKLPDELVFKRVQRSPGVDVASVAFPSELLGGDYVDTFSLDRGDEESALAVFLFDVMGHGLEATQLKGVTKKIYVQLCESWIQSDNGVNMRQPEAVIEKLNEELVDHCQQSGRFITAFYGVVDPVQKQFVYTSAGHDPLILVRSSGHYVNLTETQLILGVEKNIKYTATQVPVKTGDVFALYSDGLTEASNSGGDMYERERLIQTLQKVIRSSVKEIVGSVIEDLRLFLKGAPIMDDISLSVIKVGPIEERDK
ncbi:SpoIIE family protein phosphatase [bacterium]|nr:SpoIIE family protein phosphatase [bacterium]